MAKEILSLRGHRDMVWSVAFSPNGELLASGGEDKSVMLWGTTSNKSLSQQKGPPGVHPKVVYCVAYSPNGKYIASASWDKTVKVWDANKALDAKPRNEIFNRKRQHKGL